MKKITKNDLAKKQALFRRAEKKLSEAAKKEQARLNYLHSLGLAKEEAITLTELKYIFTDGVIKKYFPHPSYTRFNPHLSKSFEKANPKYMMKMYLMATVIEQIRAGVKTRIKDELSDEYKKMLLPTLLSLELPKKDEVKIKTRKI